ncbi:MAG: hypothetical protein [Bacteriophage sp.]|nr:MAG: hypothetical protein [Bacteriophage sp.]
MNAKRGAVAPPDYTLPLSAYASHQERDWNVLTLDNAVPVGGVRQVLPGGGASDGLRAVTGDYRAGEAVAQWVQEPGLTGPQSFNAAAVAAGFFALIRQRVSRATFAIADCAVAEDDADELTVVTSADDGHVVVNNYAITLIGCEHGVVVSVAHEVDELGFTGLRVYEAVHSDCAEHITRGTHQRVTHGLGCVDECARVEAQSR